MIAKFAIIIGKAASEFRDLNRASKIMLLVSLMMPKFAPVPAANTGELRHRDTSAMIAKFAIILGRVASEFLDLNRTSKSMLLVSPMMPKLALGLSSELWRTSTSGH